MKLVNLTGHVVVLMDPQTEATVEVEPERDPLGNIVRARVVGKQETVGVVPLGDATLPLLHYSERSVVNVPPPQDGTLYIVSGLTASLAERQDVVSPIGMLVKDGRTVARGLLTYTESGDNGEILAGNTKAGLSGV